MKSLFLHIGYEKTGTTALQNFFSNKHTQLKQAGILYPLSGQAGVGGHFGLVNPLLHRETGRHLEFIASAEQYQIDQWDYLEDEINLYAGDTIVISAEHFSSRLNEPSIKYIYERLSNIKDTKTRIVFYARRQDELLESYFSTLVKNGSRRSLENLLQGAMKHERYFDYARILDPWINQFGRESIILTPYDNHLSGNNIITDFLHIIGKSGITIPISDDRNQNVSLKPSTAYLCSLIIQGTKHTINAGKFSKISEIINHIQTITSGSDTLGTLTLLSRDERLSIINEFEQETRQLFSDLKSDRYFCNSLPEPTDAPSVTEVDWKPYLVDLVLQHADAS
jgi:hypothetical protein